MKAPLFLIDDGDVLVFNTAEDLERYAETPDISAYLVFDSIGTKLRFEDSPAQRSRVVSVSRPRLRANYGESRPEELSTLLRALLSALGKPDEKSDLPNLIRAVIAVVGYTT